MDSAEAIAMQRALVADRMVQLLKAAKSSTTLNDVAHMISEAETEDFAGYVSTMMMVLNCPELDNHEDGTLATIQDAWNYFPHRALNGRSPAEILMRDTPK
jgi:hypothetical protein